MKLSKLTSAIALAAAFVASHADASVIIGGTRVIYPLADREVSVKLDNDSTSPSLVQVWVDDGNADAGPGETKAPFVVTPPIFRMAPQKSQTLRVIFSGGQLPQDRESVYWLNVLDVPPKPTGEAAKANTLQLALRTRIKIFARPDKLEGKPVDAPAKLTWAVVADPSGNGQALQVTNPTPYFVSFSEFEVQNGNKTFKNDQGGMVAPSGTTVLTVPKMNAVGQGAKVRFTAISDYSAALPGEASIAK
ncbi:fimbria/pilus periplasmic chaperone [Variovorax dokdonensis]|uniref:Fimbria/pilus periplasmic chaperone n=1 Tax=Variovorax dokdonensis TaxID=344883 RepID=A0ABT7N8L2_9BURK|nr:fimbria/pilus periplasmic chaperone [Variovorax dokdonensis]MDM0044284.1 fimbria/pilus periplasmic chaperone [Variovorax dokdonensis]